MDTTILLWLIGGAVLVFLEVITLQLVSVWFAVGAFAAALMDALHFSLSVQIYVFIGVSFVLLLVVKLLAKRFLKSMDVKTNVDSLIGKSAIVTKTIDNRRGFGLLKVNGQEWTAASEDDMVVIPEGSEVTILRVSGVKLIVK